MVFGVLWEFFRHIFWLISYVSSINSFPKSLSTEEEQRLIELYESGDAAAKDALVEHNLRLVAHVAKKYSTAGRDADDLISIGTIGLIKGINSFSSNKGTKLSTYIARCIENAIITARKLRCDLASYLGVKVTKSPTFVSAM